MDDGPIVTILLLGNANCGKSTFLSRLAHPSLPAQPLPDSDQPLRLTTTLYKRSYRLEFSDTASPQRHYSLLTPDVVVLCYDIADRQSLEEAQRRWRKEVYVHFGNAGSSSRKGREDRIPLVLLGLKRDLRAAAAEAEGGVGEVVDPMEAYRVAQEMRCDRYAECSARTGELVHEVFEDIARVAALTTTEKGGQSEGPGCSVL